MHDQAKNLFVKSLNKYGAHLGEPGELIAFVILEAFFNAPQIACKMFLKTSEKMPIHGSDSVHIRMLNEDKLELIWGEAKLYGKISDAFDKAIDSVFDFIYGKPDDEGRTPRDRDIDIIKDMPNIDIPEMKSALLEYFDPYEKNSNNWKELYFCLVGFDYTLYSSLKGRIDHSNRKRKRGLANVNTEARGLFDDIESNIRFKYVKFSKCYNDILSYILKEEGLEEAISSIPPLHLYLELGASSTTMINLIGMGISRTAASQIAKVMLNSAMTTEEIRAWLMKQNLYALNLSNSVIAEIEEVM